MYLIICLNNRCLNNDVPLLSKEDPQIRILRVKIRKEQPLFLLGEHLLHTGLYPASRLPALRSLIHQSSQCTKSVATSMKLAIVYRKTNGLSAFVQL